MSARVIDGRALARRVRETLGARVSQMPAKPRLDAVLVGDDPASAMYVRMKRKACAEIGVQSELHALSKSASEEDVLAKVRGLNEDPAVTGVLVQLPLPEGISASRVVESIAPEKDVDGLTSASLGRLAFGDFSRAPATPKGILSLIAETGVDVKGKRVVVVNHSRVVGIPLAIMLSHLGATVQICNAFTMDLGACTRSADVLVTAVGKANLITGDMVREGAVVIDAGIAKAGERTVGDVDFDAVSQKAGWITPVPGGVGPMTVAMLLENTVGAAAAKA